MVGKPWHYSTGKGKNTLGDRNLPPSITAAKMVVEHWTLTSIEDTMDRVSHPTTQKWGLLNSSCWFT